MRDTPKNFHKKLLGISGESKARRFLKRAGYKIIEKNYRNKIGEIDVICKDGDTLVFVEVKTRLTEKYGEPSEAVTTFKQKKIASVSKLYLAERGTGDISCRFDVVEVKKNEINHIKNAFFA